ncbi:hypothetical protein [Nostoc sp.]
MTANPEPSSPKTLKRKPTSTVGRGKVVNLNTNLKQFAIRNSQFAIRNYVL